MEVARFSCSGMGLVQPELVQVHLDGHQIAHNALLLFNRLIGLYDQKLEVGAHGQVLFENAALENAETFVGIGRKAQIHARLEIFQLRAAVEDSLQGSFQGRLEEEHQVRQRGETVV